MSLCGWRMETSCRPRAGTGLGTGWVPTDPDSPGRERDPPAGPGDAREPSGGWVQRPAPAETGETASAGRNEPEPGGGRQHPDPRPPPEPPGCCGTGLEHRLGQAAAAGGRWQRRPVGAPRIHGGAVGRVPRVSPELLPTHKPRLDSTRSDTPSAAAPSPGTEPSGHPQAPVGHPQGAGREEESGGNRRAPNSHQLHQRLPSRCRHQALPASSRSATAARETQVPPCCGGAGLGDREGSSGNGSCSSTG